MNHLPPGLVGASLLFWGYQTRLLLLAIPLAVALELPRFTQFRWDFKTTDYQKLWNGCLVLFLGAVVFAVGYSRALLETAASAVPGDRTWNETMPLATRWALLFFQWQPLVFAPFMIAVSFGRQTSLPATVFAWLTRRNARRTASSRLPEPPRQIVFGPLFFALVLVAASTTNRRGWFFFAALSGLLGWALWPLRSRRLPTWAWITAFVLATGLGFASQLGLNSLQRMLVGLEANWLQRFAQGRFDSLESRTSIGSIGRMKLSGKIVLWVGVTNELPPEVLREASYDTFSYTSWAVGGSNRNANLEWKPVSMEQDTGTWRFTRDTTHPERAQITISRFLRNGFGLLPLPMGSTRLEHLPATMLHRNNYGGVRVKEAPGFINFNAYYTIGSTLDKPPGPRDLDIPPDERAAVEELAEMLQLKQKAAIQTKEAMGAVYSFLRSQFHYSLYQDAPAGDREMTPLTRFLKVTRAGHCEYFATATVLLLRAAGISARYAVGYSVQESAGTGHYLVRERHGHAWCIVWSKETQTWSDFDTTPPAWNQIESENASGWEPLSDLSSRLWYEYAQWKAGRSELSRYAVIGLGIVFSVFVLRVFIRARRQYRKSDESAGGANWERRGEDSEFYQIEKNLRRIGLGRAHAETAHGWLQRVTPHLGNRAPALASIVRLHYRLRFDPQGLSAPERRQLRSLVQEWLTRRHTSA